MSPRAQERAIDMKTYVIEHATASISAASSALGNGDRTLAAIHLGAARVVVDRLRADLESVTRSIAHVEAELVRLRGAP